MKASKLTRLFLGFFVFTIGSAGTQPGTTALLHEAAREGNLERVNKLMESVEDMDAKDGFGVTALNYAAAMGHEKIVKALIARGAAINAKDDDGITPLAAAIDEAYPAEAGTVHDRIIKLLVAHGADVTAKGESGMTALHWAVNTGQMDFAEQLITKGAEINAKEDSGRTPLHDAAYDGNINIVKLLLEKGADVNIKQDRTGNTPLHSAAFAGHKDVVMLLVANGADITKRDDSGSTPLHDAAWDGHTDIIEFLLAKGADIHSREIRGRTPLHLAAEYGKKEAVELLIVKGADLNAENEYGATPLGLAVGESRRSRELPEAKDADGFYKRAGHFHGENRLDRAIEDYTACIKIDSKKDLAYFNRGGAWAKRGKPEKAIEDWKTAIKLNWRNISYIHFSRGRHRVLNSELDRLIRETAENHLNDLDKVSGYAVGYGGSPGDFYVLSLILSNPFEESKFLKMIQDYKPIIRAMAIICLGRQDLSRYKSTISSLYEDEAEVSYVPIGCIVGKISIANLAKDIIEDPNLLDYWSPSHTEWLSNPSDRDNRREEWMQGRLDAVRSLLEKGAEANTKDKRGETPLHYAAQHGGIRFAKLLIANGAEINARNHRGETPLCVAVRWGYQDIAELLLENGADINAKDSGGKTPFDIAIEKDYRALSEFLREKTAQK
ncbi:MAG: ankyrin repeat domain-containing protein [Planctomycetota bacterium]|jgi:ankyrin repeat protein